MRLANSLPTPIRRGSRKGIHGLIVRSSWERTDEAGTIGAMYDLQSFLREWPLPLRAFVLHDPDGQYRPTEHGLVAHFDPYHLRPLENVYLLGLCEADLEQLISSAMGRIDLEIELAEKAASLRQQQNATLEKREAKLVTRLDYQLGDCKFTELGLRHLLIRARQRFFFVLAAEEILYSLTAPDPTEELKRAWYIDYSGSLRSQIFVADGTVHLHPPVLFSFVVGIQVSRIRRCGVCQNYFWAGRKDKTVCSERCGATNRKRQERQRYSEIKLGDRIPKKKTKLSVTRKSPGHRRDRMAKKGN